MEDVLCLLLVAVAHTVFWFKRGYMLKSRARTGRRQDVWSKKPCMRIEKPDGEWGSRECDMRNAPGMVWYTHLTEWWRAFNNLALI